MTQHSNRFDILGDGSPDEENLWADIQAMAALIGPSPALPFPID